MALSGRRVSVGTSATPLTTSATDLVAGQSLLVHNPATNSASVDLGASSVTTGAGFALAPGESVSIDTFGDVLYAVAASGTVTVHVLETGL